MTETLAISNNKLAQGIQNHSNSIHANMYTSDYTWLKLLVLRLPIFCCDLLSAMESFIKQMFACGACCCNQETEKTNDLVDVNPVLNEGTRKHLPVQVATSPFADGDVQVLPLPREAADEAMGLIEFTATLDKGPMM